MTDQPQQIVLKQSSGQRFLAYVGWTGFLLCGLAAAGMFSRYQQYFDTSEGLTEKFHSGSETSNDKIAILSVEGIIASGDGFVKRQIDRIRKDENVKAIVLRVNSPGGTVTGSDYIYHHLKKLSDDRKLPIVVSMGSIAASGGYYVAMAVGDQEKSIYAEPTSTTGSIGVIVPHYDVSEFLEKKLNIVDDSIASHERKQMLAMTRKMPEEHRQLVQDYVDEAFERFKSIVLEGRPEFRGSENNVQTESGRDLATGEVFSADKAKEYGLVDEIGFVEEAIDRAKELANLEEARVVKYLAPTTLLGAAGLVQNDRSSIQNSLLELSVPRAYYVYSTVPILAGTVKD